MKQYIIANHLCTKRPHRLSARTLAFQAKKRGSIPRGATTLSVVSGTLSVPQRNMYYVYILHSEKDGKLYVGSTPDLKTRIEKHKRGYVLATKHRRPLKLVYYEAYLTQRDAKRREVFLKGGKGHDELKIQLQDCFRKIKYKYN